MGELSNTAAVAIGCVLAFVSAFGGAMLALAIDEPDVVVTETVVEVEAADPPPVPSDEDLDELAAVYREATGDDNTHLTNLIQEIAAWVCEAEGSAAEIPVDEIRDTFGPDIAMDDIEFEAFARDIWNRCPHEKP